MATVETGTSNEATATTTLPAPTIDTVTLTNGDQLAVSWTLASTQEDGVRVETRPTGGSVWTEDADLAAGTTSHTTSSLLDGEQYDVRVQAYTEDATGEDVESPAATTDLPDVAAPTLGNGVEDEISVDWTDVIDNGEYDVQYRETSSSTWLDDPNSPYGEGVTSATIQNLEDGEEYEVRMRTRTEHVTGSYTTPVSIVTKFPGATNLSLTVVSSTQIDGTFTDNSDNEDGFEIWVAEELDNRQNTGFGSFEKDQTLSPNTTSFSLTGLKPNYEYQVYVRAFTEDAQADSPTVEATTNVEYGDYWTLELRKGGDIITIDSDELSRPTGTVEPSAIGEWTVGLAEHNMDSVGDWLFADAYLWFDGQLVMRGEFLRTEGQDQQIGGPDIFKQLERGGADWPVDNDLGWQEIDDYFSTNLPGWSVTVHEPTANLVDEGLVIQEADTEAEFDAILPTPAADALWEIGDSGFPTPRQTCYLAEAEDGTAVSSNGWTEIEDFGGAPVSGDAMVQTNFNNPDPLTFTFTTDHDIPESNVGVHFRLMFNNANQPAFHIEFDGSTMESFSRNVFTTGETEPDWNKMADTGGAIPDPVPAGEHTVSIVLDESLSDDEDFYCDCIAVEDDRGNHTFSETTNANDALAGPELYPESVTVTFNQAGSQNPNNVVEATATGTFSDGDVSNEQAIQLSFDDGANWVPSDGTEDNTVSVTEEATDPTTNVTGRVTLSRYASDTTTTPSVGDTGQTVESWQIEVDTNSIAVLNGRYTGSHFENIQRMLSDSGMVIVPDYQDGTLAADVLVPGEVTKSATWERLDYSPKRDVWGYANKLRVFGGVDENDDRIEATAQSDTEIAEKGATIEGTPLWRPEITETERLANVARVELSNRIAEDKKKGTVTIAPRFIMPGYSYSVDAFGGETVTLWRVDFADGAQANGTLEFGEPDDLASAIEGLRVSVRDVKDVVQ